MGTKQNFDEQIWICGAIKINCCFFKEWKFQISTWVHGLEKQLQTCSGGVACFSEKWRLEKNSMSRSREWRWSWKKARFPKMKSKQNFDEQTWICWVLKMSCCFFDMGARNRKIIKSFSGGIACFSQKWMLEQISISRYREWSWSWKKSSLNFRYGIGSWEFF